MVVRLGDAQGVALVGEGLGTLLWRRGERDTAAGMLRQSAAAYRLLGREDAAARVEAVEG